MEVAADVGRAPRARERPASRGLELSRVLAQLGLDVGVPEVGVELLLAAGAEDLARLDPLDAVLGDGEPSSHRVSRSATLCSFEPVKCCSRLP